FILGNSSSIARAFLAPGEKLIIPLVGFSIGAGIDFNELVRSGAIGVLLGLMTLVFSGTATITCVYLWHRIRRHPGNLAPLLQALRKALLQAMQLPHQPQLQLSILRC